LFSCRCKQARERAEVDVLEGFEIGDGDLLVDLVNGRIWRTEFDHLRAEGRDEPAIGRAAGRREFGLCARDLLDRSADRL
jgi:hypothetical protein